MRLSDAVNDPRIIHRFLIHTAKEDNPRPGMSTPCWNWTGGLTDKGYGILDSRIKPGCLAHIFAYSYFSGDLRVGKPFVVHHICNNKRCVAVDHLEKLTQAKHPGTIGSINSAKTHCPAGHAYTLENTYYYGFRRVCKICTKTRGKLKYDKHRKSDGSNIG